MLTSRVVPSNRSRTKMSRALLLSLSTRSLALLVNTTNRPSQLSSGDVESPLPPSVPNWLTLIKLAAPVWRSTTMIFVGPVPPTGGSYATNRTSALIEGLPQLLQTTALVFARRSKTVTDRLLLTKAIQAELALNTAPPVYPHCESPAGSMLTRVVALEARSLTYKLS